MLKCGAEKILFIQARKYMKNNMIHHAVNDSYIGMKCACISARFSSSKHGT